MTAQFGEAYAHSVAKDYVLAGLGGRTIDRALADGEDVKKGWSAVCDSFNVPHSLRCLGPAPDSARPRSVPVLSPPAPIRRVGYRSNIGSPTVSRVRGAGPEVPPTAALN